MIIWMVTLFVAGIVLLLAELILPGMICAIVGIGMISLSIYLGVSTYPDMALAIIAGELVWAVLLFMAGFYVISKTGLGKKLAHTETQSLDAGYVNAPNDLSLVGATGHVYTALRPAGTIVIGDRRIDAVSDGDFIEKDAPVRVVEVHGNRVVVTLQHS